MSGYSRQFVLALLGRFAALAILASIALAPELALAQEPQRIDLETLRRDIAGIETAIGENAENDDRLLRLRGEAEHVSKKLIEFGVSFRPQINEIAAKLAELGQAPAADQPPEAVEIASRRQTLVGEKAAINAQLAEAETLSIRVTRAIDRIAEMRRELFTNTLLRQTEARGAFGPDLAQAFGDQIQRTVRAIRSRILFMEHFRPMALYGAIFGAMALAFGLWIAVRRYARPAYAGAVAEGDDGYIARLSLAFLSTVVPSLTVAAGVAILAGALAYFGVFVGQSLEIVNALLVSAAALFFVQRLAIAVFAPNQPQRRLLAITDRAAWGLVALTVLMAAIHVIDYFLSQLDDITFSPLSLTVAKALISSLGISMILILIALVRPFPGEDCKPRPWPALIRVPLILLAGIVIVSALTGYIGLARFLAAQIVVTGAILVTMFIGLRFGRELSKEGGFAKTALGARAMKRYALADQGADLAGLTLSLFVYAVVPFAGLPLIALQWGFRWPDISRWLVRFLTDIRIGTVSISLVAIAFGMLVFAIGFLLTRRFQRWLDSDVMRRGRIDTGVRNSIGTVAGYAGIGLAALIGLSAAGFNLSNLAIVAGALSLGIGFGLQNIVNNFVSGLILLVERPFKVGDWIEAGNVTGIVRKISVRATEIETFHRQTVTLPNSEFINNAVSNWTLRNHLGRIDVAIGVAYGTDPQRVIDILMEIANADPSVVERPEPFVFFDGFGASSLDFELRVHLADILTSPVVQNRIRLEIVRRFDEEGISIPFPQHDVHVRYPEPAKPKRRPSHAKRLQTPRGSSK